MEVVKGGVGKSLRARDEDRRGALSYADFSLLGGMPMRAKSEERKAKRDSSRRSE
jgi:hypothetical protein